MNMTEAMYYVGLKEAVTYIIGAFAIIVVINALARAATNRRISKLALTNAEASPLTKSLVPKGYWIVAIILASIYFVLPSKEAIAVSVYNANRDTIERMALSPVGNGVYNKMVQKLEITPVKVRDLELIRPTVVKENIPAMPTPVASEPANADASGI